MRNEWPGNCNKVNMILFNGHSGVHIAKIYDYKIFLDLRKLCRDKRYQLKKRLLQMLLAFGVWVHVKIENLFMLHSMPFHDLWKVFMNTLQRSFTKSTFACNLISSHAFPATLERAWNFVIKMFARWKSVQMWWHLKFIPFWHGKPECSSAISQWVWIYAVEIEIDPKLHIRISSALEKSKSISLVLGMLEFFRAVCKFPFTTKKLKVG